MSFSRAIGKPRDVCDTVLSITRPLPPSVHLLSKPFIHVQVWTSWISTRKAGLGSWSEGWPPPLVNGVLCERAMPLCLRIAHACLCATRLTWDRSVRPVKPRTFSAPLQNQFADPCSEVQCLQLELISPPVFYSTIYVMLLEDFSDFKSHQGSLQEEGNTQKSIKKKIKTTHHPT